MQRTTIYRRGAIVLLTMLLSLALLLPGTTFAQGNGRNSDRKTAVKEKVEKRKAEAKEKVSKKRESKEENSQEKRQERCLRRVTKLEMSMERIASQASRYIGIVDSKYARVQDFYDSGKLTVNNYDELNGAVMVAQEAAQVEVDALLELTVDIDCSDEDVAESIAAFSGSAKSVKTVLKDYRKALVALISKLRAEAAEQKVGESSEESDEDAAEGEEDGDSGESDVPDSTEPGEAGDDDGTGDGTGESPDGSTGDDGSNTSDNDGVNDPTTGGN